VAGLVLCPGCTRSGQGSVSTTPPGAAPATRFGPDGASLTGRIAFSAGAANREDIFAVDADGTGLRRLTTGPAADVDPSWSPDGRRVAFCRQEGDGSTAEIYVMNADGSGQRNLTNNSVPDWGPAWSPDGKLIAFGSERDGPVVHLFVMRPDGTGVRRLGEATGEYPAWSPDGTRIAFASWGGVFRNDPDFDISVIDADGSGEERLTDSPGTDDWPAWSLDGARIAFASARGADGGVPGSDRHLYVMNSDGTGQTRLSDAYAEFAAWSPDGRYIVFSPGLNLVAADGSFIGRVSVPGVRGVPEFPDWTVYAS
jgi:TolB protein